MSYSIHALSSCPVARRRPLGSTATEATGLPVEQKKKRGGVAVYFHKEAIIWSKDGGEIHDTQDMSHTWAMESSSHNSDTAGHPEVPETHRLVLRARGNHPASPRIQRENVTWTATQKLRVTHFALHVASSDRQVGGWNSQRTCVSTEGVQTLSSLTVSGVDVTVSSSGANQDGSSTLWTLHEGQVSDGAVMHAELQVWA